MFFGIGCALVFIGAIFRDSNEFLSDLTSVSGAACIVCSIFAFLCMTLP
jgi:hypothetical protein